MKNKLISDLLRWVVVPLSLVGLIAFVVSPAYPGNPATAHGAPKQTTQTVPAKTSSDANADIQELKDRLKAMEDLNRQNYALELEGQRKQVDWWLTFLGVLAAIMAIAGGLIPYLLARKDKEIIDQDLKIIEQDMKVIERDKAQISKLLEEVKGLKDDAESSVEKIHQHEAEAENTLRDFRSGTSSAKDEKILKAVATVEQDKTSDYILRLRAEAVAASESKNTRKAYTLWTALIELATADASAQFNAGYWAQQLGDSAQADEKLRWLKMAGQHYVQALRLEPDMYEAAYNWGIELDAEARALSAKEPVTARELWQQAGEKYQLVLNIKPDNHDAANNWGAALDAEARVLACQDLETARAFWKRAGEKYQLALNIKPDDYDVANNWASSLGEDASVLATQDLVTARELWKQMGEKYQLALNIKPDDHEAANNWGGALLDESNAIAASDNENSRRLLDQAERLLLAHADAAPGLMSYNLACVYGVRGDAQTCLKWLRVAQEHKVLESREHIRDDKDLDRVRNAPEFVEWLKQVCP